jgi:AsmA protein
MAKPFKIFLWIVGGFFALIAVAAVALTLIFNPNDYKDDAAKAARENTGRELEIKGDIKLTLFPWLGASVAGVTLGNAKGFGPEPFAQVAEMNVGVKLMPLLFKHRVEVAKVRVDGLTLNLSKAADGTSNWADLSKEEKPEAPGPQEPAAHGGPPMELSVGGVEIKNATFSYTDKQSGSAYKVANLSVETGAIELSQPIDVVIGFIVNSAKPALESEVKIAFTALSNLDTKVHEIKDLKVDTTSKGAAVPGGSQKASLRGSARYDGGKGTFVFSDGVLEAAGLVINAAISGRGLGEKDDKAEGGKEEEEEGPVLSGSLTSNTFNPRQVAKAFGIELPPSSDAAALTQAQFSLKYEADANNARFDKIGLKLDKTTASGIAGIRNFSAPQILFNLKADHFDADAYMAPAAEGAKAADGGKAQDFKKTEIPVDAIDAFSGSGTIDLDALKLKGMSLTNISIKINAPKGQAKTEEMTALLYGGKITQSARVTHNSPWHYDMKVGLDAVNSAPLLKDLVGKSYLSGLGNFNLNVSSGGTTVGAFLQALSGSVGSSFKDGAVEGFNLDQTLAKAKAMYKGEPEPEASGPKRTEFKDLKAAGKIVNGVLDTDTLDVKGSWYQLGGDGKVNLVDQTLDYVLSPAVSGDKYKDLQGAKIPIRVSGSWYDPKVKVDLAGVLKGKAKEEIHKQEEKVKEKAKSKLGDFLKKHTEPKPAPEPAPTEQPKTEPAPTEQQQ